jgi:hypothetical protein
MSTKELFWVEFKVFSDIRKELLTIKINENDLNVGENHRRRDFEYIMTRSEPFELFKKKLPVYINDTISQVFQEIEIESNPILMDLFLDKKADMLVSQFLSEQGLELPKTKKKNHKIIRFYSEGKRNFFKRLKKKASISKLDKEIIKNENKLDKLVYLFEGQTILKNSVFFDLFQNWFETSSGAERINDLIYQLKRRADLIKPGPQSFTTKEKKGIIFRYEWLRRVFEKIKNIIEEPHSNDEAENGWKKLIDFLKRNRYFNIDKELARPRERYKGYRTIEFLGKDWLKKNFKHFKELVNFDMTKEEFKQEIDAYVNEEINSGQAGTDVRKRVKNYLKNEILTIIKKNEPSKLSYFLLSKIYNLSQRQVRRIVDDNKIILIKVANILARMRELS